MKSRQIFDFAHLANGGLQSALHCLLFATLLEESMARFNPGGFSLTGKLSETSTLIEIVAPTITVWANILIGPKSSSHEYRVVVHRRSFSSTFSQK